MLTDIRSKAELTSLAAKLYTEATNLKDQANALKSIISGIANYEDIDVSSAGNTLGNNLSNTAANLETVANSIQSYINQIVEYDVYDLDPNKSQTTNTSKVIPLYNQTDYPDVVLGGGGRNVADDGCGITCLSMIASYMLGNSWTPDKVAALVEGQGALGNDKLVLKAADQLGLKYEIGNSKDLIKNLKEGKTAIIKVKGGNHFVLATGLTADGKVLINDPYPAYRDANKATEGYTVETSKYGFLPSNDIDVSPGQAYYFDSKEQANNAILLNNNNMPNTSNENAIPLNSDLPNNSQEPVVQTPVVESNTSSSTSQSTPHVETTPSYKEPVVQTPVVESNNFDYKKVIIPGSIATLGTAAVVGGLHLKNKSKKNNSIDDEDDKKD